MAAERPASGRDARVIAFYLPQFHPIPENDAWWGRGFTEWTNATRAVPLFRGHYQPHLPAELGFYDLRMAEARLAQARLAREHGIHGFCYYHYWFHGRRLLESPFGAVLASGTPDLPFCLCWANESWTRTWDGGDAHVLMEQTYSAEDDLAHVRWLAAAFGDPRYIRIEGKPLFLVYRAGKLPNARETTARWRDEANRLGIGELFLAKVESFDDRDDPIASGFDASVEFQPDVWRLGAPASASSGWRTAHGDQIDGAGHAVHDYAAVVERMLAPRPAAFRRLPCVMPGFDNSARRARNALILDGATPAAYGNWLRHVVDRERERSPDPVVFVNAWNEWAEGNHLEPDRRWGRAFLEATRHALEDSAAPSATAAPLEATHAAAAATPALHYTHRYEDPDHSHVLVLDLVKGARRVLDVGCATGYITEAIAAQGAEVTGVEVDPRSAAIARGRGLDIRTGTVDETLDRHERFDCILLADVIEHIADADRFLESCLSHLEPGGHVVLSVPNVAYVGMRLGLLSGHFDYTDTGLLDRTHLRFYTERSLEALLARHGLATVERRHSVGPSVLRRLRIGALDQARRRVLRSLSWRFPALFGFQFVWKARSTR
jgi:2-polyprenyl-3-methyl-5-hydroxy-6-metoxy-1,4-benzoquinol methylase